MKNNNFIVVNYPEPHQKRGQDILAAHPEVKSLFGNYPLSALYIFGLVSAQILIAYLLKDAHWGVLLAVSWFVGAMINHALWVLIHDCSHNLVLKNTNPNRFLQIFANLPIFFPGAISFRTYHLQHHRYQGVAELDADLAIPFEDKIAGKNPVGKALWLFLFWAFQPLRVSRLKEIELIDRWVVLNWIVEVGFLIACGYFWGMQTVLYFFLSGAFAVGLHPVGARWIQEHYIVKPGQETYSYYGPLNKLAFNVGYHNEHHDLMRVSWAKLPQVTAMAPEFYNGLYSHSSWTKLLFKFLFDPTLTLSSRIIRPAAVGRAKLSHSGSTERTQVATSNLADHLPEMVPTTSGQ